MNEQEQQNWERLAVESEAKAEQTDPRAFAYADRVLAGFHRATGVTMPPKDHRALRAALAAGFRDGRASAEAELLAELQGANAAIPSPYRVN